MSWLDSNPVKIVNFVGSLFSIAVPIVGGIGGGIIGVHFGGDSLGSAVAATIGGFVGLVALTLFVFAVWWGILKMMRPCPICGGSGTIQRNYARHFCPKCDGDGRIF
jgi:hypothetical protein